MSEIWFTADTHFSHANIIKYCGRPFASAREMDEALTTNWNEVVKERDSVFHLGDFAWWQLPVSKMRMLFDKLNGDKRLILGNHDRLHQMKQLDWTWIKLAFDLPLGNRHSIWLSHYAHRSWNKAFHGAWHLYGHTHGRLPPYGLSCDIGVDCWDFRMVNLDTIREVMKRLSPPEKSDKTYMPWRGADALALPIL
ncbi:metallophosphoesterase [Patescibacteria group bacterium]